MLLPTVVRWNDSVAAERYLELLDTSQNPERFADDPATEQLARRLEELAAAGGLRSSLSASGVAPEDLAELASEAAEQWTGNYNPRPFNKAGAMEVYQCAF
jgi:alcohol dehydrogenase